MQEIRFRQLARLVLALSGIGVVGIATLLDSLSLAERGVNQAWLIAAAVALGLAVVAGVAPLFWDKIFQKVQVSGELTPVVLAQAIALASYAVSREQPLYDRWYPIHKAVIGGTYDAPYIHRILSTFAVEGLSRLCELAGVPYRLAFSLMYAAYHYAAIAAGLLLLYYFLRLWFRPQMALAGVGLALISIVTALPGWFLCYPSSWLEIPFFAAAAWMAYRLPLSTFRERAALFGLVALAVLNRQTGVYIAPLVGLILLGRGVRVALVYTALLGLWGVAVYEGIALVRGGGTPLAYSTNTMPGIVLINLYLVKISNYGYILQLAYLWIGFFWPLLIGLPRGLKRSPSKLRRLVWFVPIYLAPILVYGKWDETRLLIALTVPLVPISLAGLIPAGDSPCTQVDPSVAKVEAVPASADDL